MPILSVVCLTAVVVLIVSHAAIVRLALRMFEYAPPLNVDESSPDARATVVWFPTASSLSLSAALFRQTNCRPRGLIVFCPELGADKWSAMAYCEGLWRAGFDILSLDFRNHGQSDRVTGYEPIHWLSSDEVEDVRSALRYVKSTSELASLPLGLFGVSRGGGAALMAAAEDDCVQAACSDGAYTTLSMTRLYARRWLTLFVPAWMARLVPGWHIDLTISIASRISQAKRKCRYVPMESALPALSKRPVFLISGKRDTYVLPDIAKWLYECIGGDESTLWIVPDAKHNQARAVATEHYDERLIEFFSQIASDEPAPANGMKPTALAYETDESPRSLSE